MESGKRSRPSTSRSVRSAKSTITKKKKEKEVKEKEPQKRKSMIKKKSSHTHADPKPSIEPLTPHNKDQIVENRRRPTDKDISEALGKEFAETLLNAALDTCMDRFVYVKEGAIIAWDLRDTWLDVINVNWMDTETSPGLLNSEDEPPLPVKVDFWSRGAIEKLPKSHRESIMDPFLRDTLPWYLRQAQQNPSKSEPVVSEADSKKMVARPKSPIPNDTWSTTTTAGPSFASVMKDNEGKLHVAHRDGTGSPNSAASMARMGKLKNASLEVLYPSKFPLIEIKASSEMAYIHGGMLRKDNGKYEKDGQLIAFKLPNQTSSDSIRSHLERKNKRKEKNAEDQATNTK